MPPRPLPLPFPAISHLPPRVFLTPAAALNEPAIRRYEIHWLQLAAARVHKRSERTERQNRFVQSMLGIDHLFDVSDVPRVGPPSLCLSPDSITRP
jgi:hypothetical protein